MATLGFLPENVTVERPDYKLFEQLWSLMEGPERDGVSLKNLEYVLSVIRGMRDSSREIDCQPADGKKGIAKVIIFDQDGGL